MGIWDKLSNSADEIAAALKNQVTQKDISNLIDNAIEFGNEIRGKVDLEGYYKLIKDNKVWNDFVESNPSVPKNLDEVAELKDFLLDQVHTLKIPQYLKDRGVIKESNLKSTQQLTEHEVRELFDSFYTSVDKIVGDKEIIREKYHLQSEKNLNEIPNLTPNFQIFYCESARPYISQIEQNLEDAYHKYTNELQVKPYTSGLAKLVVEVYEFPGKKNFLMGYTAPEMAIELNANYLDQESVLMATPAHELFHKVQYNYGYRTKWFVNGEHNHNHDEKDVHDEEDDGHDNIFSWFAEGTAAWAEYYIANTVSESLKIKSMYFEPQVPLFKHASESFPFWDFFFNHIERFKDKRQTVHPMNVVLENLLKTEGKVLQTVVNSINQYDKSVNDIDDVFAIFCNYRRFIDETSYTPELKQEVKSLFNNKLKKLRNEQVYTASVKPLACNYYYKSRIKFDNLKNLEFTIESENQDDCLICELALNREKNPKRLKFDPLKKCYTITISEKDNLLNGKNNELILMVNGKMGKANKYTYMLSHSTK